MMETIRHVGEVMVVVGGLYTLLTYGAGVDLKTGIMLILITFLGILSYVHHNDIKELKQKMNMKGVISIRVALMIVIILLIISLFLATTGGKG